MPPTKASPPTTPPKAPTTPPAATQVQPKAEKAAPRKDEVTLAVVIGAHGIGGEVRLKVFAENFGSYKSFNNGALSLKSARNGNNGMIARFAEVADRNAAEAMRGTELTVPRSSLPPLEDGEYYHTDVIGLDVVSTDGEAIGRVVAIDNFGAGDVIEIERLPVDDKPGKRFMIPMRIEAVPEWDAERLVVEASFAAEQ